MNPERTAIEEARNRLATNHYMEWEYAGGPHPCKHGVAAGIPCRRCDKELVDCKEPSAAPAGVPRFSIEFHRGVYFSTPELGTCEVVKASDYDAADAARSVRDREMWDLIDKTQSCTSGKSSADCLESIKHRLSPK